MNPKPDHHATHMRHAPSPRTALIVLLAINLMNYVDRQILAALEKPIGEEYGVGPDMTGWLPFAFMVSYMVCAPVFGVLANKTSRWLIVGAGVILWSLASGGSGAVNTFALLIAMRVMIGIGEAAYGPIAPTLIADAYPVASRGKVLAWFYAAIPVGSALGYVIGGQFHHHWHWAFYLTVPPGVALGLWALWLRDPQHEARRATAASLASVKTAGLETANTPTPVASGPTPQGSAWETPAPQGSTSLKPEPTLIQQRKTLYRSLLSNRSFVLVSIGMTAMTFAVGGIGFFMPRWLEEHGQDPQKGNTIFGAIVVVAGLFATLAGGWAGDKLRGRFAGSYFLVSGGAMVLAFPLFLLLFVTPFPACWLLLFATVFCLFFNTGPSNAIIANVTAPAVRATAFAINIFVIHLLGDAISPALIGMAAKRFGSLDKGFIIVGVAILIGGIAWLLGTPHLAKDTAAAEEAAKDDPTVAPVPMH